MEWQDAYSLDIREIDDQHKKLIGYFSAIESSVSLDRGWSEIHFGISRLRTYAKIHFEFEEALQRMFGYGQSTEHEEGHRHFFSQLKAIEQRSAGQRADEEIVKFLSDWLTQHILVADRDYAKYILSGASIVNAERVAEAVPA